MGSGRGGGIRSNASEPKVPSVVEAAGTFKGQGWFVGEPRVCALC